MNHLITLLCIIAVSAASLTAETVEERVDALEKKVDTILKMLEQQKGGARDEKTAPAPGTTDPAKKEDGKASPSGKGMPEMQKGTMLSAFQVTDQTSATPQTENPVVLRALDSTAEFKLANFLLSPAGKLFEKNQIGVKWEGYLSIAEPGTYEFVASSPKVTSRNFGAVGRLAVEGQNVITQSTSNRESALGTMKLEGTGMYAIEIWLGSARPGLVSPGLEFRYRKQGQTSFEKITPGSLYCPKAK